MRIDKLVFELPNGEVLDLQREWNIGTASLGQLQVNVQPAPAVLGDWADRNPRYFFLAGQGALVAGAGPGNPSGVNIGRAAWANVSAIDNDLSPAIVQNSGTGPISGIVHRDQQALITQYLADAGLVIPAGFGLTLCTGGGLWVKNEGSTFCAIGNKAYASFVNGAFNFAPTGNASTASAATSTIAATTALSATGSISNNVLTLTNIASGLPYNGTIITGTGVATGTQIIAQLTGAALGVGTYAVSIPEQTVTSTAIAGTSGTFTAGSALSGLFVPGGILSGGTTSAGTVLWSQLTGPTGGLGTYIVSPSQTVASATITETVNVETKWIAMSAGAVGELVKISSQPLG